MKFAPRHQLIFAALFAGLLSSAPASAGGLDAGTQAANTFKLWFYGFAGICASIYLLWVGLEIWGEKARWIDFAHAVGKVAGVGAVIVIAPWAWTLFI
ncbi:hypothetical protein LBW59_22315 [Ralstonia solanacearum]|uniref:Conjugal transfer protein n=1 Tax=Ralstonia solanacearum TaxID=305 RepID=A0AAW5ZUL8_RALSL|nr:hypothetical protein [Ralstonia solanacearum]MDB0573486.1 hypothetical protein [Ralstonia solanacearum]